MIKQGNAVTAVLNGEVDYLIHCVNGMHKMGSGIALEVKNRVPMAYAVYMAQCPRLGHFTEGGKVINLCAQWHYGGYGPFFQEYKRHLDYGALRRGLERIAETYPKETVFGLPYRFGSDRAGGDWDVVKKTVEDILPNVVWYKLGE